MGHANGAETYGIARDTCWEEGCTMIAITGYRIMPVLSNYCLTIFKFTASIHEIASNPLRNMGSRWLKVRKFEEV
jgi:hypothetical protein